MAIPDEFDLDVRLSEGGSTDPALAVRPTKFTCSDTCADTCDNTCADSCLITGCDTCEQTCGCGPTSTPTCFVTCGCGATQDECSPTGNQATCGETCSGDPGRCDTSETCVGRCEGLTQTALAGACCV